MKTLSYSFVVLLLALGCTEKVRTPEPNQNKRDTPASASRDSESATQGGHFTENCKSCHEDKRPATNHIAEMDCVSCHQYPNWSDIAELSFSHTPKPESCELCHSRPLLGARAYPNQGPPADFQENASYPGSGHYLGKDCGECHQTPDEGVSVFAFSHVSPVVQACLPCHYNNALSEHSNDNDVMLSGFGNCYNCHKDFNRDQNRNFEPENDD